MPPAVVHIDLDGAPEIYAAHGWRYAGPRDHLFLSGMRRTLDLLDELGIRATLFVIVQALDDAERLALVKEAVKRGHRLASHTLTHRFLPSLPAAEQRREIGDSKRRLEDLFGAPVAGFRSPSFGTSASIRAQVAEAGYRYDSSLFADAGGEPWLECPGLAELPLPRHQPLPVPFHPSYSLVLGTWYFRLGLRRHRATSAPLVLLLHLTDCADPVPDEYLSGWKSRVFTLSHRSGETKRERCRVMLADVARRYRWSTDEELIERAQPRARGA